MKACSSREMDSSPKLRLMRWLGSRPTEFMPAKMGELLELLAIPVDARSFDKARREHRLAPDTVLLAPAPVFPRYMEPEEGRRTQG